MVTITADLKDKNYDVIRASIEDVENAVTKSFRGRDIREIFYGHISDTGSVILVFLDPRKVYEAASTPVRNLLYDLDLLLW